jgi:uncharacterized membrane protein YkvA (DUF1232 family)
MREDWTNCPGPLFEKPIDRVVRAFTFEDNGSLRRYFAEPLFSCYALKEKVSNYLAELEENQAEYEFLDLPLARRIASQCHALLDTLNPQSSDDRKRLIQVAVIYFIEDDDAEGDTTSPIGFDDDAEVVELIARELGLDDIIRTKDETK